MDTSDSETMDTWARDVAEVQTRARFTAGALVVTALFRGWDAASRAWSLSAIASFQSGGGATQETLESADRMVNVATVGINVMLFVTGVLFLRWVHRAVKTARSLGGAEIRWTPSDAVWSFIIPIVSIIRPFHVLRDLHDFLAPDRLPVPVPRVVAGEGDHYRGVTTVDVPPPPTLPSAFIGAWWGSFVAVNIINRVALQSHATSLDAIMSSYRVAIGVSLLAIVAAVFAVYVVRGVTARLVERHRRVTYLDREALAAVVSQSL